MKSNLDKLKSARAIPIENASLTEILTVSDKQNFPLMVQSNFPGLNLEQWVANNNELCQDVMKKQGAILFRNFNINSVEDFTLFVKSLGLKAQSYTNRTSPRYSVAENVYTTTTQPKSEIIHFHSENSYAQTPPDKLIFCCIIPAKIGGETPLADNRKVLQNIPLPIKEKFARLGVMYKRIVSDELGLGWKEIFQVENKEDAEEQCRLNGIQYSWSGDILELTWKGTAIRQHPNTGEEIWFNHAFFFNKYSYSEDFLSIVDSDNELPFSTYYGDGSSISKQEYDEIKKAYEISRVDFLWQKGDLLMVDNYYISHARNSYEGDRQILVSIF
jgi:alpha-ketoglutarate-dependent taurine dioxygenase